MAVSSLRNLTRETRTHSQSKEYRRTMSTSTPPPGPDGGFTPPPGYELKKKKSFFARHKILTGLGALLLLIIVVSAASGGGSAPDTSTSAGDSALTNDNAAEAPAESKAPAAPAAPPANDGKPSDDGWVVESYQIKDNGIGSFQIDARVTNTENSTRSGAFTFTIFKDGQQIATLNAFANDVEAGKTQTLTGITNDKYVPGPYTIDFQNDF